MVIILELFRELLLSNRIVLLELLVLVYFDVVLFNFWVGYYAVVQFLGRILCCCSILGRIP